MFFFFFLLQVNKLIRLHNAYRLCLHKGVLYSVCNNFPYAPTRISDLAAHWRLKHYRPPKLDQCLINLKCLCIWTLVDDMTWHQIKGNVDILPEVSMICECCSENVLMRVTSRLNTLFSLLTLLFHNLRF
jgi:hypothetical protein